MSGRHPPPPGPTERRQDGGTENTAPSWAVMSPKRLAHVRRVAVLVTQWADRMRAPASELRRWLRAVWLHDALRDAPDDLLMRLAPDGPGPPSLRHGPASAVKAAEDGEDDPGVLDAVRYHSLGYHGWDMVGRVLYCADYLEPGRVHDRDERDELARRFPEEPDAVLRAVASRRIGHHLRRGLPILEPTWRFWNNLAGGE